MSRELPEWQPYDPASSPLPDIRGTSQGARGGAVIVLLETPGAREEEWGARAAASLASRLARSGRRIFLADLDVARPALHRVLGVANDEGVSDAFVYGASIQHVAQPVDDGRYFFAPAGTVLGDTEAVASSPRWDPVLEGFRTARADVVLLVPAEQDGADRILDRATDVVVLGGVDDEVGGLLPTERVRAVLGPATAAAVPAGIDAEPGAQEKEGLPIVPPPPGGARGEADGASVVPAATRRGRTRTPGEEPRPRTSPTRLVLLLLLLLAAVAAAWWFGVLQIPGLPAPTTADASPAPAAGAADVPPAPVLAASLTLEAFRDPALARIQRDALAERRPDLLFVVAPVEVDGQPFYRLLVGPATDSASAAALRASLAGTLPGEDAQAWLVRATPLAFRLDELDTAEAASARVEELRGLDIPAYVLEVSTAPDRTRHRVYAGAFADAAESAWLGRLLAERGIADAVLTERAGRAPAAPSPG